MENGKFLAPSVEESPKLGMLMLVVWETIRCSGVESFSIFPRKINTGGGNGHQNANPSGNAPSLGMDSGIGLSHRFGRGVLVLLVSQ